MQKLAAAALLIVIILALIWAAQSAAIAYVKSQPLPAVDTQSRMTVDYGEW